MTCATIVFDFDGTLADSKIAMKTAMNRALEHQGRCFPSGLSFDKLSCMVIEDMFLAAGLSEPRDLNQAICDFNECYADLGPDLVSLFPGVRETLPELRRRGYQLAVATNEIRINLDRLLTAWDIFREFNITVCADEVTKTKPDIEMLDKIAGFFRIPYEKILMVGDSILDIQMGKAAGGLTCAVTYGSHTEFQLRECNPDYIIHAFSELLVLSLE